MKILNFFNTRKKEQHKRVLNTVYRATYRVRKDIDDWQRVQNIALAEEMPQRYPLYNLYDDIMTDALLSSQIENRMSKTLSRGFKVYDKKGVPIEELSELLAHLDISRTINRYILETVFYGHSLIQLEVVGDKYTAELIPRQNVIPEKGEVHEDLHDGKHVKYRDMPEYGSWILEFGKDRDFGLLNKAAPHAIFKKFAQSCWSELAEIYGIPPRVLKTNTSNPDMVSRAKKMMMETGAAPQYVIDELESMEFATSSGNPKGEVFESLIRLCNNEMSMLISGAVLGQDTLHGNEAKEKASQGLLESRVNADIEMIERSWNNSVLNSFIAVGIIPQGEYKFKIDTIENTDELWQRTREILPYKDVDDKWIQEKFKIKIGVSHTGDISE